MSRYVFDIESNNFMVETDKIWLAVMIDLDTGEEYRYDQHQMEDFKARLESATELVGHNIVMFDLPVVRRLLGARITAKLVDTLIISRMMFPDRYNTKNPIKSHSLSSWGEALGEPKTDFAGILFDMAKDRTPKEEWKQLTDWKKNRVFAEPPNDTVSEAEYLGLMMDYCAQDCHVNVKVYNKQLPWMTKEAKPVQLEHIATAICATQVENGWGYDAEAGEKLEMELQLDKAECLDELRKVFPTIVNKRFSEKTGKELKPEVIEFNPQSHLQVYSRLNEKYDDNFVTPMTEAGNPQCDSTVLESYKERMPEIQWILRYRDIQKLEGQVKDWNERAHKSPNGRIHGGINVQGATTGRCTHSGPNMAQVSGDSRARGLWVAGLKDHVVLGADLSGLELRMLAHYMAKYDKGAYGDVILNGDIHTANQEAAGLSTRNEAKTFIYGFLYGAGDAKIGQIVGGNRAEGKRLKEQFLKSLPALKGLIREVSSESEQFKSVYLPDQRRVPVRSEHAALNTLLQGAGAVVSKYWMIVAHKNLTERFGHNVVKQMAYVHDEMQYACPKDIADEAGKIVTDSAVEAGERLKIRMRIDAEYDIGQSWKDTH